MIRFKLLLGFAFLCVFVLHPQCAMCRVVAESSKDAGETIANGLNTGILYLMSFPYILLLFGLISIYLNKQES